MQNYVKIGELNRALEQRRRAEARKENIICRLADIATGFAIGFLVGLAIYMIR